MQKKNTEIEIQQTDNSESSIMITQDKELGGSTKAGKSWKSSKNSIQTKRGGQQE